MIDPPISVPCSGRYRTVKSQTGSASSQKLLSVISAPMARSTSRIPVRVGLTPTPCMVSSEPGTIAPATRKNAAEEMSPGMVMSTACRSSGGLRVIILPWVSISTPSVRNIRSVWSREGAGSMTVVCPSAYRPASRMALLSCAEATGRRYSIPCSSLGYSVRGQ